MDKALEAFIAKLPNDNRRTIVLKMMQIAMTRDAVAMAKQRELAAKATPTAQWLQSLEHVVTPKSKK
ncbi:MAG TPA: hypothetical protein VJ001_02750 [Rhodocyclaceae bacterium]|nr:hypothetical protein [Rhodocyclaceae bacterium]